MANNIKGPCCAESAEVATQLSVTWVLQTGAVACGTAVVLLPLS